MLYGILHRGVGGLDMATQEERLQKLEHDFTQFKADAVQSHQEMAMQFTVVSGLTDDVIKRLKTFKQDTYEQLSDIKQDIGAFYVKFDRLDRHVIALDKKTDQRFTALEEKFDNLDRRFGTRKQNRSTVYGTGREVRQSRPASDGSRKQNRSTVHGTRREVRQSRPASDGSR